MTFRSLRAIVSGRLRAERRTLGFACATAAVVGFVQPHGITAITDPLGADLATRSVWLAGPMFFCSTIGFAVALLQGPGRHVMLDASEQSAPLFGRELARAKAVVPALVTITAAFVYWFAQFLTGFAAPPVFFALALFCVLASSAVSLNATLREGAARWLYIALGCATAASAYCLAVYGDAIFTRSGDAVGVGTETIFCALVGFIALRQYGEALARYDP
ncbi:MAG: hypothetical protein M3R51_08195 [Candidatus Eremiobacteraeota bacterium]|nr:hypothetical protein [Candidatus Eremiobacteraeota bacterium]